jgi:hypothetical protein
MALTYGQITALTESHFIKKLADNIYSSKALVARLAAPGKLKLLDGGHQIIMPIIYSKPGSDGRFYEDLDELDTSRSDNITAAKVDWKQQFEPIRISRKELLMNSGDAAKLSLIASKMQIAQENIDDVQGLGMFSDGTAATGANTTKQHTGLRAIISTTSDYAGIAVADFAGWAAVSKTNSGTNRSLTLNLINQAIGALTEGKNRPTIACMKQDVHDEVWSLFQPHQRLMSESMKKLGFEGILEVNGIPFIVDSHMVANKIFLLNENFLFLAAHRQENWRKETINSLETTNSMLTKMYWMGNLICNNRRFQGELADIEVAS